MSGLARANRLPGSAGPDPLLTVGLSAPVGLEVVALAVSASVVLDRGV